MNRGRAYLSRLHFILKRMQHRKPLKAHKDARTLARENASKIKEEKRMETRKEKRKRSTEPRTWKRPKAITWDEATGCPSSLWQPHQGVVSFVPTHTSRGWGPTTILRAPSLDSPVKALPHTEVFLDTSDPADQTQKHNACQGGNTALGTERVLIPHHLHLHTWVAPSSCNPSPFTNLAPYSGHASSSPPLVFLEDEATFPGLQAFFFLH